MPQIGEIKLKKNYGKQIWVACEHCGNSSPGGNFWIENENDNIVKIQENIDV